MHAIDLQSLEVRWQKCKGAVNTICADELARRARLRVCLLEFEKEDLEDQIADDADLIDELESTADELQASLQDADAQVAALRHDLKGCNRDISRLQTELASLQETAATSQQLLSEKLALSRELSSIKPEVEHLRAQRTSYQEVLSEKLALQRQLGSIELELDNERKSAKRMQAKESTRQDQGDELHAQIDALKEQLAQENRQRKKLEQETTKAQSDFENQIAAQESRIDGMRTKLKVSRDELKKTQTQLSEAKSAAAVADAGAATNTKGKGGKRSFADIAGDVEFATPGAVPAKKVKSVPTQIGEKSTFSMTPFLKKTGSAAPESPPSSPQEQPAKVSREEQQEELDEEVEGQEQSDAAQSPRKPAKGREKSAKSAKTKDAEVNKAANPKKITKALDLGDVDEGQNTVTQEPGKAPKATKAPALKMKKQLASDADDTSFIKRKRKLGNIGKTIFDDDDASPSTGAGSGAAKPKVSNAFGNAKLATGGAGRGKGISSFGGLGGFSPRKKDRQAAAR